MWMDFFLNAGYGGAFLAGFISSATLFLPLPGFLAIFALGAILNPLAVGILAGLGAAIGEMIGYGIGYGSDKILFEKQKKMKRILDKTEDYFNRYYPSLIIFIFAALPLPFDIVGLLCGSINYSAKRFFIATFAGKLVKYIFVAYAGFYGMQWVTQYFGL